MSTKLTFCGGTGSVTGANFLMDTGETRFLIDCGLEQGMPRARAPQDTFPYEPSAIDTLIITHAHLDHIGRVPLLVKKGFRGAIYSTPATKEIAALMFDDALGIMQQEQQKYGTMPLYERADANQALLQWQVRDYHQTFMIGRDDIGIRFHDAGHVLGSAMAECTHHGRTIVFTGDVGNSPAPLLRDTESLPVAHYLVMESVYGDRVHEGRDQRRSVLRDAIEAARKRRGVLLIPAFSLGRTQALLFEIRGMIERKEIEPIDTYLDSPLAEKISEVYRRHIADLNAAAQEEAKKGDLFTFPELSVSQHPSDSEKIADAPKPKVIIAGSGMSHGGRIQSHEKLYLGEKDTELLFVGYQAAGTLGRRLQEGEKRVRIDDSWVRVHARVSELHGYSAHADRDGLMRVAENGQHSLEKIFVAMGEPRSAMFLAQRIHDFLGLDAIAPKEGDSFDLDW